MSLGLLVKNGIKMVFSWIIGAFLILIGVIIIYKGFVSALTNHSKGTMYITLFIGLIIASLGGLIIWWGGNRYNVELGPGYKSRPKKFHY